MLKAVYILSTLTFFQSALATDDTCLILLENAIRSKSVISFETPVRPSLTTARPLEIVPFKGSQHLHMARVKPNSKRGHFIRGGNPITLGTFNLDYLDPTSLRRVPNVKTSTDVIVDYFSDLAKEAEARLPLPGRGFVSGRVIDLNQDSVTLEGIDHRGEYHLRAHPYSEFVEQGAEAFSLLRRSFDAQILEQIFDYALKNPGAPLDVVTTEGREIKVREILEVDADWLDYREFGSNTAQEIEINDLDLPKTRFYLF